MVAKNMLLFFRNDFHEEIEKNLKICKKGSKTHQWKYHFFLLRKLICVEKKDPSGLKKFKKRFHSNFFERNLKETFQ